MPIDPLHLIAFAVAGILVCLLGLSLGYEIRRFIWRKKKEQAVYRCHKCRRIYMELHRIPLARCPECGTQNKPIRH